MHSKYPYNDGTFGTKHFIIVADVGNGTYLSVKTTSQQKRKCLPLNDNTKCLNHQDFFVKVNYDYFDRNTWIQLDYNSIKEWSGANLMQDTLRGMCKKTATLNKQTFNELIQCLQNSVDLLPRYKVLLRPMN